MSEKVDLSVYTRALDEIYSLRAALAYESQVIEAHLSLKTFPKSRQRFAWAQVDRMKAAARGRADVAYAGTNSRSLKNALTVAGASQTLTRWEWEQEILPVISPGGEG